MHRKIYLLIFLTLFVPQINAIRTADISTSVSVPPSASNYSLSISNSPTQSTYAPNSVITYTITYGNNFNIALPLTITANWTDGTISGQSSPSVDVADYVVGSGTNAYGSTHPVINTENQTITWSINSFPGDTSGQSVSFELETNSNYTGTHTVAFTTSAYLSTTGMTTPSQDVTLNYKYPATPSPTPTPTPGPTGTPNPNATASPSPSPSPTPQNFLITSVGINSLSNNSATIEVNTNSPASVKINYATSLNNLSKQVSSKSSNYQNFVTLNHLQSNTIYYYEVIANNNNGNTFTSDIFTFRSASLATTVQIDQASFVAASENTIVSKPSGPNNLNTIVLPIDNVFGFKFSLSKKTPFKKAVAIIRNESVLGALSFGPKAYAATQQAELVEVSPGVFSGKLATPSTTGNYGIYVRIYDTSGNILEQKVSELYVIKNFTVFSKDNNQPIEGARILLSLYNVESKKYQELPPTAISILNPSFTDSSGQDPIVLPQAKYMAQVSEIGYNTQNVYFEIVPKAGGYPTVYMERRPIGIADIINYLRNSLNDVFIQNTATYIIALTGSVRFFNLIAVLSLGILVLLALFAFVTRTRIPLTKIPHYFLFYLHKIKGNQNQNYVSGVIKDTKSKVLANAHVYLVDLSSEEIIGQTKTNSLGHFFFRNSLKNPAIIVMEKGYKTTHLTPYKKIDGDEFSVTLEKIQSEKEKIISIPKRFVRGIFGFTFEWLLLFSFIFELMFLLTFGFVRTLPFLTLSIFNLFIWIVYLRVRKGRIN